jgi:hypothetical protein
MTYLRVIGRGTRGCCDQKRLDLSKGTQLIRPPGGMCQSAVSGSTSDLETKSSRLDPALRGADSTGQPPFPSTATRSIPERSLICRLRPFEAG